MVILAFTEIFKTLQVFLLHHKLVFALKEENFDRRRKKVAIKNEKLLEAKNH